MINTYTAAMWSVCVGLAFAIALASSTAGAAEEKITIAVMDINTGAGIDAELQRVLIATLTQELDALGIFEAVSNQDIKQMLQTEIMKQQAFGCDTVSCLAEVAGAIGAQYTITGNLVKIDSAYLLQMQLVNAGQARPAGRVQREVTGGPADLLEDARAALRILVRDLLALKSGTLRLQVSESGASVRLNGTIIGVTPMDPFQAPGGVHTVSVEKEGFIAFTRDVQVEQKQGNIVEIRLQPSEEYKRAYEASANRYRTGAWIGIGVGAAAMATGIGLAFHSRSTSIALNADIDAYEADTTSQTVAQHGALERRAEELGTLNTGKWLATSLGVAALGTGLFLYFTGDDPDHFRNLKTDVSGPDEVHVRAIVGPDGMPGIAFGGRF